MLNPWANHLILECYSVGPNLTYNTKISKQKNLERIASASILKASLYQFKGVNQTYLLKNSFNCETFNLVHAVICTGGKEEYIGETGCLVKEWISIHRQHIRQPQHQQLVVEEHLNNWRILERYSIGLNLNCKTKIKTWKRIGKSCISCPFKSILTSI